MANLIVSIPLIYNGEKLAYDDEQKVEFLTENLRRLIDLGALKGNIDDFLKDFDFDTEGFVKVTVDESAIGLSDHFNTVGASYAPELEVKEITPLDVKTYDDLLKTFSVASIQERMRINLRDNRQRFRYTVLDYKRYFKAKESKLKQDPKMASMLLKMFLTDLMGMITDVLPYIKDGKQLSTLVGTNQVTSELNKVARELSLAYKYALKQQDSTGMINKAKFSTLKDKYSQFMTILVDAAMPGLREMAEGKKVEPKEEAKAASKKYSRTEDGRIDLFAETPEQLEREAEEEVKAEEEEALSPEVIDKEELSQKEYSRGADGRIKLF